jgi:hypothetical protein
MGYETEEGIYVTKKYPGSLGAASGGMGFILNMFMSPLKHIRKLLSVMKLKDSFNFSFRLECHP